MTSQEHVASSLRTIRERVGRACERVGRDPAGVTILGASKGQPLERLRWAWEAGLRVYGENRVQEALGKIPLLPTGIEWHLIGPLQSNKVNKAVATFNAVHSIDRPKIAQALDLSAAASGRSLLGFLEINLAEEETKHGFSPAGLRAELAALADLRALQLEGLMAIPPFEAEPEGSRRWFRQLRQLRDEVFSQPGWRDRAGYLSMGMSHDYTIAVEEGATHIRIGSSLFGPRIG